MRQLAPRLDRLGTETAFSVAQGSSPSEWCSDLSCRGQAVRAVRGSVVTSLPVFATVVSRQRVRTSRPR